MAGVGRVAQDVLAGERGIARDERVEAALMDVDPLDAAAALARVEAGAVDQVLDRVGEVGVLADIGRVLAAQLQVGGDEGLAGRCLHGVARRHRAGERHELRRAAGDDPQGLRRGS